MRDCGQKECKKQDLTPLALTPLALKLCGKIFDRQVKVILQQRNIVFEESGLAMILMNFLLQQQTINYDNIFSIKNRAILVGLFILVAYGVLTSAITQSQIIVMFADAISAITVILIAVLTYPLFKHVGKSLL